MTPAVRSPRAISCAPVRVATSMMASGYSWLAATMPSAMTRRPSASVLRTSTVLPPNMVRTSAGRWAAPEGMFSAMHSQAVALTGRPRPARASTVLRTTAAPAMSLFMSPMPRAGLMRDAAGVKGDALAHEGDLRRGLGRGVFDLDQAGLPGGALADAEDAAEAVLFQALLVPDGDLDGQALGQFLGRVGKGLGVEVARAAG